MSMVTFCAGCTDDMGIVDSGAIPDGKATLKCNIVFEPMLEADVSGQTRATNAPDGKAISELRDLCILFFNAGKDTILADIREISQSDFIDYDDEDRNLDGQAESTTKHAVVDVENIPYGKYYVYAVANLGSTTEKGDVLTTTKEVLDTYISENGGKEEFTASDLKRLPLAWDRKNILNNAEMLGYFTAGNAPGTPTGLDDAQPIEIKEQTVSMHSWLRRAASKLTLEFDPSGLRNNVRIFIKRARLRHIPLYCPLGNANTPSSNDDLVSEAGEEDDDYYHLDYFPEGCEDDAMHEKWMTLARGGIMDGNADTTYVDYDGRHTEWDNALYFYENMQGMGKDKRQDADGDGALDYPGKNTDPDDEGYKDQKPYGTYLEVEAYYVSNAPDNYGKGTITYRFMLGKNETTNYDAERNHHYKVTMKFRGNANEVDWHVDYNPDPDILYAPDPYYISYTYGSSMELPLYISGKVQDNDYVEAKIVENGWGPAEEKDLYEIYTEKLIKTGLEDIAKDKVCNGFLALEKPKAPNLLEIPEGDYKTTYNRTYWKNNPNIGYKRINSNDLKTSIESTGAYNLELWTREKTLVTKTGFSGNNQYPQYQRKAVIELSGIIAGQKIPTKQIRVYQVRRIINPSGVYRKYNNKEAFEVVMSYRNSVKALKFQPLHSVGPWKAHILCGDGWEIYQNGVTRKDDIVGDDDGSEIRFMVKPSSIIGEKENRCAVVEVLYNNYTCSHKIVLRQGDEPISLVENGKRWYSYNLESKDALVKEPMDCGSMFRHGNIGQPISASDLTSGRIGEDGSEYEFTIVGSDEKKKWSQIDYNENDEFTNQQILNGKAAIAESTDYYQLQRNSNIQYKYGVLYGDDATKTQMVAVEALEYLDVETPARGVRGCFVYNNKTGHSIFFPLGSSGMGRIKNAYSESGRAVLRYANRSPENKYPYAAFNPVFYDIEDSEGALYWLGRLNKKEIADDGTLKANDVSGWAGENAWDINFRTLNFNTFNTDATALTWKNIKGSDAAFIRCVVKGS